MKKVFVLLIGVLLSAFTSMAQNTLNLHQKSGGVVSYGFAEKPVVTYVGQTLHLETTSVSIDYPLSELEKMTFTETEASIGELRVDEAATEVSVYRMDGTLVKRVTASTDGATSLDTTTLPNGAYLIKTGNKTIKIIKR